VNAPPASPTAGSNSPVCSGNILSLTASNISGATYSWTGPNSFTSGSQNPTIGSVTTLASGTYSVTANVPGCPASAAGTTSVVIYQTPSTPVVSSNSPVCAGDSITLFANGYIPVKHIVSVANFSFTPSSFNAVVGDTVEWDWSNGSHTTTSTTIPGGAASWDNPINSSSTSFQYVITVAGTYSYQCTPHQPMGMVASFTASAPTQTYSWNGPNAFASSLQNPVINSATTANSGNYSVTVSQNGCTGSAATSVTVNPIPAAPTAGSNSPVCSGTTLSLTASSTGTNYSWNGPNSFTSSSQNPTVGNITTAAGGTYSVTATANGCTSAAGTE
jgi:plastocyanin